MSTGRRTGNIFDPDGARRILSSALRTMPTSRSLVLEGDLSFGDLNLKAGDFHVATPSSSHPPGRTVNGCLVHRRDEPRSALVWSNERIGGRLRWTIEPCGRRCSAIGRLRTRTISTSNMKSIARMPCLSIRNRVSGSAAGTTFSKAASSSQTRSDLRSGANHRRRRYSGLPSSFLPMTAFHPTR